MHETDFDAVYREAPDPFGVATRWYERRKQQVLLASLAREHYASAWDCAAGTGHLASALAGRCDRVVATDASPTAVGLVEQLTREHPHVLAATNRLPEVPAAAAAVELVVAAEVLYYLPEPDRAAVVDAVAGFAREVVLVHWAHHPGDAWLSGADVQEEAAARLRERGWTRTTHHVEPDFVLAGWVSER